MKAEKFPLVITKKGVQAKIRKVTQFKKGQKYDSFVVEFVLLGKRKQVWRSNLKEAQDEASAACDKISNGNTSSLELNNGDHLTFARAVESLLPTHIPLDTTCREYAEAVKILEGKASLAEVCRDWMRRNALALPKITAHDAAALLKKQAVADGKSNDRQKQLCAGLDRFSEAFGVHVHAVTPSLISTYLAGLPFRERTKRNHRDTIGFFNRWLVMRGYLAKGTDWLEGVQNYTARKLGEISIYTADEMRRLIAAADDRILPLIVIGGFAGLRHAEIARLDWQDIDLEEGFIEVKASNAKTDTRRIVPIKANLKLFLQPLAKKSGKVVSLVNTTKQLLKTAVNTGDEMKEIEAMKWKHNALRHTYISARVAECGDVARVADEAGNSPQVVRTNYLKRMRPAVAAEWFSICPLPIPDIGN
jgi:integrase